MFVNDYLEEVILVAEHLNQQHIEDFVDALVETKVNNGRLFVIGLGGSLATASHSVNDFRKIAGIETYAPGDNASELTARTNDDGFETIFTKWLEISKINSKDTLLILSVGGGSYKDNMSVNLILAAKYAKENGCKVIAILGNNGGEVGKIADTKILIPTINTERMTPHAEEFQGVILHLLVSHPLLQKYKPKWESIK